MFRRTSSASSSSTLRQAVSPRWSRSVLGSIRSVSSRQSRQERSNPMQKGLKPAFLVAILGVTSATALASAGDYSTWSQAVRVEATPGTHPTSTALRSTAARSSRETEELFTWRRTGRAGSAGSTSGSHPRERRGSLGGTGQRWGAGQLLRERLLPHDLPRRTPLLLRLQPRRRLRRRRHLHNAAWTWRLGSRQESRVRRRWSREQLRERSEPLPAARERKRPRLVLVEYAFG